MVCKTFIHRFDSDRRLQTQPQQHQNLASQGIGQEARIADHPGPEKSVADEKQDMSDGSGGERP